MKNTGRLRRAWRVLVVLTILTPSLVVAQELHEDLQGTWRARVVAVVEEGERDIPGTDTRTPYQEIEVEILEGERKGEVITIENDYIQLKEGDRFFLNYLVSVEGHELYSVQEVDRRGTIFVFLVIFVVVVLIFGGLQGLRSLMALAGSLLIIFYLLLPQILNHASPLLVSAVFSALILACALYITHGFNRKATAAFAACMLAILLTIALASIAVQTTRLTGFADDAAIYLNLDTRGELDFSGLFLAAIIIGVLGILDDIAITQASAVEELMRANAGLSRREIYKRAMKIGREHVGALINTLALAYTGTALPLLLLLQNSGADPLILMNREIFAAEIIRTIVGSTGIILTVPIATLLAVMFMKPTASPHSLHVTHGVDGGVPPRLP